MKKTVQVGIVIVMSAWLAACTSPQRKAPVVDRAPESARPAEPPKPSPKPVVRQDPHGYYTVKKGDTLLHIALEYGQNYRDIIAWNNLTNPDEIKVDQMLRVLPPEPGSGHVAGAATPPGDVKPQPPSVPNKTSPRGDKKIYSDAALAELQKPDAPTPAGTTPAQPAKPDDKPAVAVTPVKPPEPPASDEESISWTWPTEGKIISAFEEGKKGVDIGGKIGQPVVVAAAGKVMYAGSGIRGYGNLVIVKHANNMVSAYAHNRTILVKEGQMVMRGQKIAEMGSTDAESVKLHFEIRQQGKPVDPTKYLPSR